MIVSYGQLVSLYVELGISSAKFSDDLGMSGKTSVSECFIRQLFMPFF